MAANDQPNVEGLHLQEIQASITALQDGQAQIMRELGDFRARLGDTQNAIIRLLNKSTGPNAPLIPLVNPRNGLPIENAPRTALEIFELSAEEATRILQILGVPIEDLGEEWLRRAVLNSFL